ncbi:MAG: hypothetical protein KJZ64_10600 [Sphingomonadaceae bacterium]|nr:hypothetical protein [Sphingomonadaceae bacterium]
MIAIRSRKDLEIFLPSKPAPWTRSLAARSAMRVLTNTAKIDNEWLKLNGLTVIRMNFIIWLACFDSSNLIMNSVTEAGVSGLSARNKGGSHQFESAVSAAYFSILSLLSKEHVHGIHAINYASSTHQNWESVSYDLEALSELGSDENSASRLMTTPLWRADRPTNWHASFRRWANRLLAIDTNYRVWIEWYECRLRGEVFGFNIPGDKNRFEDKGILNRIINESNNNFWNKGHEFVNSELARWLYEARERAHPKEVHPLSTQGITTGPPETSHPSLTVDAQLPPPQNRNVLSFKSTPEGRIAIDATAMSDRLRNDQDARQRYDEAVSEAKLALDRCLRSNAGARLTRLLENYLAATGEGLDDAKPSLIVQRGERLRQELTGCENPDSFIYPIADDLRNDLMGWRTAHNMMVGLDPVLNAADLAMLGPDRQPALIPPDEIEEKVEKADQAGLIETGDAEIIAEGIALAPASPDINDRRTIWSVEVIRNLFSESMGIALNPLNADAQASGIILMSGFRAVCGSIDHAKFIVENRDWILDRLGSTPTWRDLIDGLVERLETITPFDPK